MKFKSRKNLPKKLLTKTIETPKGYFPVKHYYFRTSSINPTDKLVFSYLKNKPTNFIQKHLDKSKKMLFSKKWKLKSVKIIGTRVKRFQIRYYE